MKDHRTAAEDSLRASEEFSRNLMDGSVDCIKVLDLDGRLMHMNQPGLCLMEIDDIAPLCGKKWSDLWPQESTPAIERALADARSGKPTGFQAFCPTAKGNPKWWEVVVSPIRDAADGNVVRLLSVSRDITERRQSEEALRQNATLFSTLIAQAPMGTYVVDADFRLVEVNAEALPVFASVRPPLIGSDFAGVMEQLWGPEVGRECAAIFRHTLETGERYISPPFTRMRHDLAIEQTYEWETQRITLPDGRSGVVCYFHEVTENARTINALQASQTRMRVAAQATGVGFWEWNLLTNTIQWDSVLFEIYGIEPTPDGRVHYHDWSGAVLPEDLAMNEAILQDTVRRCSQSTRSFRIRRRNDGECRYIEAVETVRLNTQGTPEWVIGTNLDVTSRKRAEDNLQRLNEALSAVDRRKDVFLATLSHEIRNPLASLRTGVELVRAAIDDPVAVEQICARMERQAALLVRLVDDLMDVSRVRQDKLVLRTERMHLATALEMAIENTQPNFVESGQVLSVTIPPEPIEVDGDAIRLAQVFVNILANAAKYSHRGSTIWLTVERHDKLVEVRVKDNGIGIAPEQLAGLFEMFAQVDDSSPRGMGGLGIGLYLVKRMVKMHGGSVEARSEGLGHGSEFIVRLPLALAAADVPHKPVLPATDNEKSKRLRILVADDNEDGRELLAMLLRRWGHDVQTAGDGMQAVTQTLAWVPDLVLLDIGMPVLDGYEACRRIRAHPAGDKLILIAVTGLGQEKDRRSVQAAGFDRHLVKPLAPAVLASLLQTL